MKLKNNISKKPIPHYKHGFHNETHPIDQSKPSETAIIYCEENFGRIDGKTANGLVRYSEKYEIIAVIDRTKAGLDSGIVLDNVANGIPIFRDLTQALEKCEGMVILNRNFNNFFKLTFSKAH